MFTLFIITASLILMLLAYPLWLLLLPKKVYAETNNRDLNSVSVIYLSQNGEKFLHKKISFLIDELSEFTNSEIIIIDDGSNDSSLKILEDFTNNNLRIIKKHTPSGIPHSVNMGVKIAKYDNIIFCDQRQYLSKGAIKRLIEPLKYEEIGAVSASISNIDKMNTFSILRAYENFIKKKESRIGNLIGVYGPLYAIKKECYNEIPEYIILDDLYLTLKILSKKQVLFLDNCIIYDDNIDVLYNYKRTRRYLSGFGQLISEKKLISHLTFIQITMLIWHKYIRLIIPFLILICMIILCVESITKNNFLYIILIGSISFITYIIPIILKMNLRMNSIFRVSFFYAFAIIELTILGLFFKSNYIWKK